MRMTTGGSTPLRDLQCGSSFHPGKLHIRDTMAGIAIALSLSACGSPDDPSGDAPSPETEAASDPVNTVESTIVAVPGEVSWQLESDGDTYTGDLFEYYLLDGDLMIQLINRDAVNFALAFEGEATGERPVSHASFTEGRGPVCWQVGPLDRSTIRFDEAEPGWLTGRFSATLGCPDARLLEVEGVFHITAPGE